MEGVGACFLAATPVLAGFLPERLGEPPILLRFVQLALGLAVLGDGLGERYRLRLAPLAYGPYVNVAQPLTQIAPYTPSLLG